MKIKIITIAAFSFFSITSIGQQLSLDFDRNLNFDISHNSLKRITTGSLKENPIKDKVNQSNKVYEITYVANGDSWDHIGFSPTRDNPGFKLDADSGKFIRMKFLTKNTTTFSLVMRLHSGEETKIDLEKKFQDLKLNTWYETEFDFSSTPDCWVSRLDPWFDDGAKHDGDVYLVDDFFQSPSSVAASLIIEKVEPKKPATTPSKSIKKRTKKNNQLKKQLN